MSELLNDATGQIFDFHSGAVVACAAVGRAPALGAMISLAVMTVLVLGSLVEAIRELL
jgi:hypothetical protein